MSELLALSFDCISSPDITLHTKPNKASSGWGFGWYPNDGNAASVVKDIGIKKVEDMTKMLSDWSYFRSSIFLCKVLGAAKTPSQRDTQPFHRTYAGRDWLFIHNGDLDKTLLLQHTQSSLDFFQPLGKSDSELVFCYLLQQFKDSGYQRLLDMDMPRCHAWLNKLDECGSADFVLSDSECIVLYHGSHTGRDLYFTRHIPPYRSKLQLYSDDVDFSFQDPQDRYRSLLVCSSSPLEGCEWEKFNLGECMLINRSEFIWRSETRPLVQQQVQLPSSTQDNTPQAPAFTTQTEDALNFTTTQYQIDSTNPPNLTHFRSATSDQSDNPLESRTYKITHLTEYAYSSMVEHSNHVLHLHPIEDKIQKVVHTQLSISPHSGLFHFEDVFANHATYVHIEQPYEKLSIQMESLVKIYPHPIDNYHSMVPKATIPLVWMPWHRQMMLPYLLPPELPESQLNELSDYAMSFVKRADNYLLETLSIMNKQIHKDYRYEQGTTNLLTSPFEVYAMRRGVCQDFANLLICLARLLNIPARYSVGYIYTGAHHQNQQQAQASHAWVEVYLPFYGWKGYDPTNGCEIDQEHIRVACGRNYIDAAPVTGTLFKGGRGEVLSVDVKVEIVDDNQH